MSKRETTATDASTAHVDEVADGCGCAEIWEHLSERRESETADRARTDADRAEAGDR